MIMPREIEYASKHKNLVQQLISRVLVEAGSKIKTIDDNRHAIAECETLSDRLEAHGLTRGVGTSVDVGDSSVDARVTISGQSMSAIRDAIKSAGLHIYSERPIDFNRGLSNVPALIHVIRIDLTGLDCPIVARNITLELAEAA
jgi:hypothetical protein